MSQVSDLKKAIAASEKEIDNLEKKRSRSQSAILEAFLNGSKPDDRDAEYFRIYAQLIELERQNLRILHEKLDKLS